MLPAAVAFLAFVCLPTGGHAKPQPQAFSPTLDWSVMSRRHEGQPQRTRVRHLITPGENLGLILSRHDVPSREVGDWCKEASRKANLRRLTPGQAINLSFIGGELATIEIPLDDESQLVVTRIAGPVLDARIDSVPVQLRVVGVRGVVKGAFHEAAQRAGLPDPVISSMVDALAWKIDFEDDVRPGDQFRVLYEQRVAPDGRPLRPGRVLAAEYLGKTHTARAFLYADEGGEEVYLDASGEQVEPTFLRYPLEFTRITSPFSYSRFHPILKRYRPHEGVDFAAPRGTPVRAIGSGTVRLAGWKGELGRTVEIDHGNGLISVYGHLRYIQPGIRPGTKAARGQVIGAVGTSGLSTGSHLHFAVFEHKRYVNPLTVLSRKPPVARVDLDAFEIVRADLAEQLRNIPGSYGPTPSTPPVALSAVTEARRLGSVSLTL